METTLETLQALLIKDYQLAPELLTREATLESLGIDSLGGVELLFSIEDRFGLTLPPQPVPLPSIGHVVDYIDQLRAIQSPQPATARTLPL